VAAESYNVDGFQVILNLAKKNLTKEDVNKLLLATNNARRTVFMRHQRVLMKSYFMEY
jgi:hypothetical protein